MEHLEAVRKVVEVELDVGAVQEASAGSLLVGSEDGIIQGSTGVVGIDVEVVVLLVGSLSGLEMEGLGGGVGGAGSVEERGGGDRRDEGEKGEELHFDGRLKKREIRRLRLIEREYK